MHKRGVLLADGRAPHTVLLTVHPWGDLMDPHGPIAQRFRLVSRFRPACLPLPRRVHGLVELTNEAPALMS
ncbi:hypothetical protein ACIP79_27410 [Streptomyces sp. NPDC088747]|uniref:hypothetical protein n=1 Tax=Streptomyces sp. NPDC088747 TaxID=3365886 RepID=UPI0038269F7C